jgi:hypothetical protein
MPLLSPFRSPPRRPAAGAKRGSLRLDERQRYRSQFGLHIAVAGGDIPGRSGVLGLQEQSRGDKAVVGYGQVEPVGQGLRPRLDVLEDGVDVAGDLDSAGGVAVVAQPWRGCLTLPRQAELRAAEARCSSATAPHAWVILGRWPAGPAACRPLSVIRTAACLVEGSSSPRR